jgi:hypothetical protein
MEEMQGLLGGASRATVYRVLRRLGYRSSYNHNGRYYTIVGDEVFDRWGLWSFEGVRFSLEGTLTGTVRRMVTESEAGWTRRELQELLGVRVQTVLATLLERGELEREKVGPAYVYVALPTREEQLTRRREQLTAFQQRSEVPLPVVVAVLVVLVRHPKSDPATVVRHLKGHSPPIHVDDVQEVFDRYELGQKRGLSSA